MFFCEKLGLVALLAATHWPFLSVLQTNDASGRTRAKIFGVSVNASLSSSRLKMGIRCIMRV